MDESHQLAAFAFEAEIAHNACDSLGELSQFHSCRTRSDAMSSSRLSTDPLCFTRRQMLTRCGTGLGMLGLAGVLADEGLLARHSAQLAAAESTGALPAA